MKIFNMRGLHQSKVVVLCVVSMLVIVTGLHFLSRSHAAPPLVSVEPEAGNFTTPATAGTDTSASGGKYVAFAAPTVHGIVDPSTMARKFMLGYQGWHQCPTDGSPGAAWRHWFSGAPSINSGVLFDGWPDTSELTAAEKCDTGLKLPNGQPAYLFSDYNPATVNRHFAWMKDNGIDGVMLQRFSSELSSANMTVERNQVTKNVMAGAVTNGRTFDIMYDISGQNEATLVSTIENDWKSLVDTIGVTKNGQYLRQNGRPVVVLWGFGFADRPGTPADLKTLLDFFHNNPNPAYDAYVMGGVNNDWRTNATWATPLNGFDAISPWTVGRYNSLAGADNYKTTTAAEVAYAKAHNQMYMPVIFPGFSFHNQSAGNALNQIPRLGGNFLWRQAYNDMSAGASTLYGAMFDEVNEGTAFMKQAPTSATWPAGMQMVPVNSDGYSQLPSDWYLQEAGQITQMVRGTIPLSPTMSITPH
jgi:hypothetical protein